MRSRKVRVLIIEDFIPFQRLIQLVLEENQHLQMIGVAADGAEGACKAKELNPDLILLDIGLPRLNGIEAAKKILASAPQCRIVIVTQESSADSVRESLAVGARGYVSKSRIVSDLLPAIKAVLEGNRFTSSGLTLNCSPELEDLQNAAVCKDLSKRASRSQAGVQFTGRHNLQVHSSEEVLLRGATCFLGHAICAEQPAICVASEALRRQLFSALASKGIDIKTAIRQGRYIALDVEEVVSLFMPDGAADAVRFTEFMGGLIKAACQASPCSRPQVAVFAECTSRVWATGNTKGAMRVERLWNHLTARQDVNILCSYAVTNFHGDEDCREIRELCEEHSFVLSR